MRFYLNNEKRQPLKKNVGHSNWTAVFWKDYKGKRDAQ
jgi:hypothetical protein